MSLGSLAVVLNAAGGRAGQEKRAELSELFRKSGLEAEMFLAAPGEIEKTAEKAAETADVVVAAGGDGTVNCVAGKVLEKGKSMAVLPLGTLNHFCRDIGMPREMHRAVPALAKAAPKKVDVGVVNDRIFLNNSGLGLYPYLVGKREEEQRLGRNKRSAALWAALAVFRLGFPFVNVRLEVDRRELRRTTPMVFVGNNRYELAGFRIGRRERLDGGVLTLYVAHKAGRRGLIRLAFAALFGQLHRTNDFDAFDLTHFTIESGEPSLEVSRDGELSHLRPPLEYAIRPRALAVLAPRSRDSD